ncbi:High-affinity branched-chain amino acid transport system permease protein LivH (TC 3.A.1.4.1) [hydrothermal vent metagenome]|uniref:High-affinity branched-chain amino acid transport system permease protein LivH (TC 3.A.1.4.1) n=1 Tax=hydrothermal vent metagenome TaxID=652676 RepID=A0A3B0TB94_9ZZZZ
MLLFLEQLLNGFQLGVTLLLLASGLTLVFGIMGLINLAHGALYMVGAYVAASVIGVSGSFALGLVAGLAAAAATGMAVEAIVMRRLYERDHLDQVLATFGLILFFNEMMRILWGRAPLAMDVPQLLSGSVEIVPGAPYPVFRLAVIVTGIAVMVALHWLIARTRVGMWIRAGASNREMISALGVDIGRLFTLIFGLGALLAGLAGVMAGPFVAVDSGMGDGIIILTFVVVVIGGIGSLKGAAVGALLVGLTDTLGRAYLPDLLRLVTGPSQADAIGASIASMSIYILMAVILALKPEGLFRAHT